jgi:cyclase
MDKTISYGSKHFALHALADGVYAAIAQDGGAAISNAGLIDLGGQIVVFDTFLTPQAALDLRRTAEELLGRAPHIAVNSHYHNDHIWGNQVFASEAQIISSTRTRELIATDGMEEFRWNSANAVQKLASERSRFQAAEDEQQRRQLSMWVGYWEGLVEDLPHLKVCLPQLTFDQRLELHGSQLTAQLITFEGAHTGSDTVLYLPHEGIVFMSDLLFVGCHPYLSDGGPYQFLKALNELSQLDAGQFVPGHGPIGTKDDLRVLIEYVEGCLETAQSLVKEGNPDEDRFGKLQIPEKYKDWQLAQFYQANIRFLCQRIAAKP